MRRLTARPDGKKNRPSAKYLGLFISCQKVAARIVKSCRATCDLGYNRLCRLFLNSWFHCRLVWPSVTLTRFSVMRRLKSSVYESALLAASRRSIPGWYLDGFPGTRLPSNPIELKGSYHGESGFLDTFRLGRLHRTKAAA